MSVIKKIVLYYKISVEKIPGQFLGYNFAFVSDIAAKQSKGNQCKQIREP